VAIGKKSALSALFIIVNTLLNIPSIVLNRHMAKLHRNPEHGTGKEIVFDLPGKSNEKANKPSQGEKRNA
jgi:hypothetical protein